MANPLLLPELRELLGEERDATISELIVELHPASLAEFSEGLTSDETWRFLNQAPVARQATIFAFYPPPKQLELVSSAAQERLSGLLEAMSHDDRVDLLKRLAPDVVEGLLPLVTRADREDIRRLLSYPEQSAGAVMTTDFASIPEGVTVGEALERVRQQAPSAETIYYAYVLGEDRHLRGMVSLRDLIVAKPAVPVADIMQRDVISVRVDQDREYVAQQLAKYDFLAIPVIDNQGRLVGIVTHDDVLDVVTQAATEDAFHMAAVETLADSYLDTPFRTVWRRRAAWLSVLFVAELLTFTALASYDEEIKAVLALSFFVPLCISTGGNSGSQAATLITRAMALGQIQLSQWWRVVRHELLMGLALGATLGAIAFLRASVTPASILGEANRWMLAAVISQSVGAICLWGTMVGAVLPLIFRKLGFDPGYASSPFVATFVDVTGIVIYFSIAKVYML